jgi:His-Xaa-Ser system protein HxsD
MTERTLTFETPAYSLDAVQRAAYRFSDRLSVDLRSDTGEIHCRLHIPAAFEGDPDVLLADFRNEVLDHALRERIRSETEGVRNLVLSLAFSKTDLSGD